MQGIASEHRIRRSKIGSIPIVGPLVSPLVDNGNGGGTQPPPANPPPAPVSTSSDGNGGGNGNGNGGGNGNGHGGGNGNGNGGGDSPFPTPTPTPGAGSTPPNSAPGAQPSAPGAKNPSSGSNPSSQQGGGYFLGTGGGQTAPVNAASGPPSVASTPGATGVLSPSPSSPGAPSDTLGASSPTISTVSAISSGKQLSGGAVAGITIMCLIFFIALILMVIRRRSIAHRLELRKQWWSGRNVFGQSFISRGARSPTGSPNGEAPASRLSARSSFATNFDQGLMLRIDSPSRFSVGLIPDFPPPAEVRERNSALISTGGAVARRESMNSMLSNGSYPDAQYLTVSPGQNNLEPSTPMSVRPFSPSESFAFPKPPAPPSSTPDSFFLGGNPLPISSQSSAATPVHLSTPPLAFMPDLLPTSASASLNPQIQAPNVALSPFVTGPNPSMDPFGDPPKTELSNVEVIRRPFTPSLEDEMAVVPDDRVRTIRVFDDGWAFVEKLTGSGGDRRERGLIPIDCFRDVDQALPSFLAEKRVSYGSQPVLGTPL